MQTEWEEQQSRVRAVHQGACIILAGWQDQVSPSAIQKAVDLSLLTWARAWAEVATLDAAAAK